MFPRVYTGGQVTGLLTACTELLNHRRRGFTPDKNIQGQALSYSWWSIIRNVETQFRRLLGGLEWDAEKSECLAVMVGIPGATFLAL